MEELNLGVTLEPIRESANGEAPANALQLGGQTLQLGGQDLTLGA